MQGLTRLSEAGFQVDKPMAVVSQWTDDGKLRPRQLELIHKELQRVSVGPIDNLIKLRLRMVVNACMCADLEGCGR